MVSDNIRVIAVKRLFFICLFIAAFSGLPGDSPGWSIGTLPFLGYDRINLPMYSPVSGVLVDVVDMGDGFHTLVVQSSYDYWLDDPDETVVVDYHLIMEGLRVPAITSGDVNTGTILGVSTERTRISALCDSVVPAFLRYTTTRPRQDERGWWFRPDWVNPTTSQQFTFRPGGPLDKVADDYLDRTLADAPATGQVRKHDPERDRLRLKLVMDSYPLEAEGDSLIKELESFFYQRNGLFVSRSTIEREGYSIVMWWQPGFTDWLKDEYTLGEELWLFLSFYAVDHDRKEIIAFVRDFSGTDPLDIVRDRLSELESR